MPNSDTSSSDASDHIPQDERFKLWVRSGGRCAICNEYLLEDEFTGRTLNLAEAAHVVGRRRRGPRGQEDLASEKRNLAENLMLLCQKHHKVIDEQRTLGDFPRAELLGMKNKHERRVRDLTAMVDDQETVVLRAVGDIRGASVVVSKEEARSTVLKGSMRYPRYDLCVEGDLEIDLRGLPDEGSSEYWAMAARKIDVSLHRLRDAVEQKKARHLSVFAFGRIPLLMHLGHAISDKIPHEIYQKHRDAGWDWPSEGNSEGFETCLLQKGTDHGHVALLLSVSGSVAVADLPSVVDGSYSVFEIRPTGQTPNRDIIASLASLHAFSGEFKRFLSQLEVTNKPASRILVFPAVPLSVAVVCGRDVMRESQPALEIYDRTPDGYAYALTVNRSK